MILQEIAENTRKRLEKIKEEVPLKEVQAKAQGVNANTGFPFKKALKAPGISFICEVKKASPSKGVIAEAFPLSGNCKRVPGGRGQRHIRADRAGLFPGKSPVSAGNQPNGVHSHTSERFCGR